MLMHFPWVHRQDWWCCRFSFVMRQNVHNLRDPFQLQVPFEGLSLSSPQLVLSWFVVQKEQTSIYGLGCWD
jgi:hypothetical protein